MYDNESKYPAECAAQGIGTLAGGRAMNPTFRENIDMQIQHHKDEIIRLERIKEQMPQLLDVNLRDLRQAMQF